MLSRLHIRETDERITVFREIAAREGIHFDEIEAGFAASSAVLILDPLGFEQHAHRHVGGAAVSVHVLVKLNGKDTDTVVRALISQVNDSPPRCGCPLPGIEEWS